ncbi:DEAD/DEAH box helicase [bacterium]|nr:DEAD/DEAH box helicase [bacterium]
MDLIPFTEWPLRGRLQERLGALDYRMPTQVQQDCWEDIVSGRDLLVQSCTGTGKTLAFALPLLNDERNERPGSVLIVLPTRELAMQVAKVFVSLEARTALLYGGGGYAEQLRALKAEPAIIVGTPGRLLDHLERGSLDLSECRVLVLDEADEILDMGFAEELDRILAALPEGRQSLLFSATLPPEMEELASKTLHNSRRISVSIGLAAAKDIRHEAYEVAKPYRLKALANLLCVEEPQSAIIFCHTKAETDETAQELIGMGVNVLSLHGDMAQAERTRTLNCFRSGNFKYLIATDVAARGLDVQGVTHVFNMGVPQNTETYIHRVGRTGRAGRTGKAITFASGRETLHLQRLLSRAGLRPQFCTLPQAEDVRRRLREQFHKYVSEHISYDENDKYVLLASELLAYLGPNEALAAALSLLPQARAVFESGWDVPVPERRRESKAESNKLLRRLADKIAASESLGMSFIQLSVGKHDGCTVGSVLKLCSEAAGLAKADIGEIEIRSHTSFAEVPTDAAAAVLEGLKNSRGGGKPIKARLISPAKAKVMSLEDGKGSVGGNKAKKNEESRERSNTPGGREHKGRVKAKNGASERRRKNSGFLSERRAKRSFAQGKERKTAKIADSARGRRGRRRTP